MQRTLTTSIMWSHCPTCKGGDARIEDNPTPALLLHERQTQLREQNTTSRIHPPRRLKRLNRDICQVAYAANPTRRPSVGKEHINAVELLRDLSMQSSDPVVGGEVGLEQCNVNDGWDHIVDGMKQFVASFFAGRVVMKREVVFASPCEGYGGGAADSYAVKMSLAGWIER